jgi:hypothetical protein
MHKTDDAEITVTALDAETILVVYKLDPRYIYGGTFVFNFNLKSHSKTTGYFLSSNPEWKGVKFTLQPEHEISVSLKD